MHLKKKVSVIFQQRVIEQGKGICFDKNLSAAIQSAVVEQLGSAVFDQSQYKARHAHKHLYTVLPKYSKIQVLPGITSCRLMKYNKQAIELNSLLINDMPKDGYE